MFFENNKNTLLFNQFKINIIRKYQSLVSKLNVIDNGEVNLINPNKNSNVYNLIIEDEYQIIEFHHNCHICQLKKIIDDFNTCDKCHKLICNKCISSNQYHKIICNNCKNN